MKSIAKVRTISTTLLAILASTGDCRTGMAESRKKDADRTAIYAYGLNGPNRSYQAGPYTRIYVTKRSWLDGGTEVLPAERKFSDYAFPPGYSFARENNNRPLDRQPLNPTLDMGGFSQSFPLY